MQELDISRRKLGGIIASMLTASGIGYYVASNQSNPDPGKKKAEPTEENKLPNNEVEPTEENKLPEDAKNISEYGARPNPEDPDLEMAEQNLNAIRRAANAAGPDGAIYVPAGTYFLGNKDSHRNFDFGGELPAGISWYGKDPHESVISLTEHMDKDDSSHVLMYYGNDVDHGTVRFRNIQFFGNGKNLDGLTTGRIRRSSKLIISTPKVHSGTFDCSNIIFYQWFDGPLRGRMVNWNINNCTFLENGAEARKRGESGHSMSFGEGNISIVNTRIVRSGSYAVNYRYGDGDVEIKNCFVKGYGTGFLKIGAGDSFNVENTFVKGTTDWVKENYPEKSDENDEFKGRYFIYNQLNRNGLEKKLRLRNVHLRDCTHEGIKLRRPTQLNADNVVLINANTDNVGKAAISAQGPQSELVCVMSDKQIAVYDSNKFAINVRSDATGRGSIKKLCYNNTHKYGNLDQVTISDVQQRDTAYYELPSGVLSSGIDSSVETDRLS